MAGFLDMTSASTATQLRDLVESLSETELDDGAWLVRGLVDILREISSRPRLAELAAGLYRLAQEDPVAARAVIDRLTERVRARPGREGSAAEKALKNILYRAKRDGPA